MTSKQKEAGVNSKEVAIVEKEVVIADKATKLVIKDDKSMKAATELLSQLNLANDNAEAILKSVTKPQKEAIKAVEAIFKPFINRYKDAISYVRGQMSDYQTRVVKEAREREAEIAERIKKGKGNFSMETGLKKMGEIDQAEKNVVAESGSVVFVEVKVFEVVDISKLPAKYLLPNETEIRKAMNAGLELPGVKYDTKQQPRNSR